MTESSRRAGQVALSLFVPAVLASILFAPIRAGHVGALVSAMTTWQSLAATAVVAAVGFAVGRQMGPRRRWRAFLVASSALAGMMLWPEVAHLGRDDAFFGNSGDEGYQRFLIDAGLHQLRYLCYVLAVYGGLLAGLAQQAREAAEIERIAEDWRKTHPQASDAGDEPRRR